ncbi:MAG: hypothetical protein GY906_20435 [bacterium]|nr:hypothetical protein [bacterium]
MPRLSLIASSDDYLLEETVAQAVSEVAAQLGGLEPEVLGENVTPEQVALEVQTPSLFEPSRLLVVEQARRWVKAKEPSSAPKATGEKPDPGPLVEALSGGLPDDVALIVSVWCVEKPKGELVDVISEHGEVRWISLPAPPKPWEDVVLSESQREVLGGVLRRALGEAKIDGRAANLLMDRLGFAPRLLAQEGRKLASAAGSDRTIDEELVRSLTFPAERSLERVRDAVLKRQVEPLLDLVSAAQQGIPVRDWRGQRLDVGGLTQILIGQVGGLFEQLLYLRCVVVQNGLEAELKPSTTSRRGWYARHFKTSLAPNLIELLRQDPEAPLNRSGKPPSPWTLGELFTGAGRYSTPELVAALAELGGVEVTSRGALTLAGLMRWLTKSVGRGVE